MTDALTGVANRRGLEAWASLGRPHSIGAIALDLDSFKQVNDRLGHNAGDRLLKEVASAAATAARQGDILARTGGDEFVLLAACVDDEALGALTRRVLRLIDEVGHAYGVSGTAGTALSTTEPHDLDTLIRVADSRLIYEKSVRQYRLR